MSYKLTHITLLPVWNALGTSALEIQVQVESHFNGNSITSSGLSVGSKEITKAIDCENIRTTLKGIIGKSFATYGDFDLFLNQALSPLNYPSNLLSAISIAFAKAVASMFKQPLWMYLSNQNTVSQNFPIPFFCICSGGIHGNYSIDFQDIMIIPQRVSSFGEALQTSSAVFQSLKKVLMQEDRWGGYGIKGAYLLRVQTIEEALDLVMLAIERAGYKPGHDFLLGIDVASTTLWNQEGYCLRHMNKVLTTDQLIQLLIGLAKNYPLKYLEDPLHENDLQAYAELKYQLAETTQIISDDLCVSKCENIMEAYDKKACDGFIIKPSQAGTLINVKKAKQTVNNIKCVAVLSARSGDNELPDIMDIAWAFEFPFIKVGGFFGSEIISKYNQGLRIEHQTRY